MRSTAHTKNRGEVKGSGKKPWRQKGTGRARAGSVRSPLWRGGGVTFGPTAQNNFRKRMPAKQREKAVFGVLHEKIKDGKMIILLKLALKEIKTKNLQNIIASLPVEGTILLILPKKDEVVIKSAKNIPYVKVISYPRISTKDLLNYDFTVMEKSVLDKMGKK